MYLIFYSQTSQYEHSISDEQLVEINNTIKNNNDNYITIEINEDTKTITIDYT